MISKKVEEALNQQINKEIFQIENCPNGRLWRKYQISPKGSLMRQIFKS